MQEMSWKEKLITKESEAMKNCHCSSCGGDSFDSNFCCQFCGNENTTLKEDIHDISSIIKDFQGKELEEPLIVITLEKLKDFHSLVSPLSQQEIDKAYLSWAKGILSVDKFSSSEEEEVRYLFQDADLYQDQVAITIQDKIIMDTVLRKGHYSREVITEALYHFFYQIVKPWVKRSDVSSSKLDNDIAGLTFSNEVKISHDDIQNLILHGSSNVINTIGHEARHVFQNYKMMHNIVENKYDLFMLYDTLVDFYTKGAYWDNYYKQFAEIDARIFGYAVEEKFLNMYGYTLSSISKEKNNADMMLLAQEDTMRVIDGKEVLLENQLLSILNENLDLISILNYIMNLLKIKRKFVLKQKMN